MIQLSPQIQSTGNFVESAGVERSGSSQPEAPGKFESEKTDGPGAFAQLLAGLLRNTRDPPGESRGAPGLHPGELKFPGTREDGASGEALSAEDGEVSVRGGRVKKSGKSSLSRLRGGTNSAEDLNSPQEAAQRAAQKAGPEAAEEAAQRAAQKAARKMAEKAAQNAAGELPDQAFAAVQGSGGESETAPGGRIRISGEPAEGEDAASLAEDLAFAGPLLQGSAGSPLANPSYAPADSAAGDPKDGGALDAENGGPFIVPGEPAIPRRGREDAAPEEGGERGNVKARDRRRDRLTLEVRDLRTAPSPDAGPGPEEDIQPLRAGEREILVELSPVGAKSRGEIGAERENRPAESFQSMLARELHQNLNGDIVRHASILLRDGGEGLIRLSLKPESLGTVKIRLEMAENKIAGHIIVESDDAFRAFEREIRSLEQAFRDSGYDGANFEMSLAQDRNGQGRQWQGEGENPFFSERLSVHEAASAYDDAAETVIVDPARGNPYGRRDAVNMLA